MVADKKFSSLFFYFILLFLPVSLVCSARLSFPEEKFRPSPLEKLFRTKRQVCVDGTYEHGARNCCMCAAGQRLETDCVTSSDDRICKPCESKTYNSQPNSQKTCLPCTSCSQPNANLEEVEKCTPARDTKCQCKKDHYCTSDTGSCKICHPCTACGSNGIKEACTRTRDAVCNEAEASNTGVIVGIVIALIVLVAGGLGIFFWKKKQADSATRRQDPDPLNEASGSKTDVDGKVMQPLIDPNVDLQPLMADIAEVLGWKDMEHLAIRSQTTEAVIQSCKLDHKDDSQEQTLQLLKIWVEKHGRDAPTKLVQMLRDNGKKGKSEKIHALLTKGNSSG